LKPALQADLKERTIIEYANVRFEAKCPEAKPEYRTSTITNGTLYLTT